MFTQDISEPQFSILGLHWAPEPDSFIYNLNISTPTPTKRHVLSIVAKIYDLCGYLAPRIVTAKCFVQLLWTQGYSGVNP